MHLPKSIAVNEKTDNKMRKNLILSGVAACACLFLSNVHATTMLDVGLSSPLVVGEVIPQISGGGGQEARDLTMLNTVVADYNAGSATAPYFISGNSFVKPLPTATTVGDVITPLSGISFAADGNVTITIGTGYHYLIAAYDGQNSGAVVWDIDSLAAGTTIEIPRYAYPNAAGNDLVNGQATGQYGITTWSLFSPAGGSVPDGGTTVLLLGAALSGLGLIRRKMS